jgi:signal transduction histidine kinase
MIGVLAANPRAARAVIASVGLLAALSSLAWIDPSAWPIYAVFFVLAVAFSFVHIQSGAPASVAYMATATAFVYIGGFPILGLELLARVVAYPLQFKLARRGLFRLPPAIGDMGSRDRTTARNARLDLAAMLGLANIGSTVRVGVVALAHWGGTTSLIVPILCAEAIAYGVMGLLSARLPLPTSDYVVAAPLRLSVDDERVDVIFSAVLITPFLVLLINYAYLYHGLWGAAAWSVATLAPHGLVQLLAQRRHLLVERTATLARKQREVEDFVYTVAHDLKAPLSAITMTSDLLLDSPTAALAPAVRRDVARILRLASDTENMIVDLLGLVRIVSEPEPVADVALDGVVAHALDVLRPHIGARGVRIDVAPLPVVRGQATKLGHVVVNLIGNAIRFVPPNAGTIQVAAAREREAVVLSVRDNGIGIPPEYHHAIFEMFRRVPQAANGTPDGGSGMGLAIVKRIVESHDGEVWVESTPGHGSVFHVRLPVA